MEEVLLLRRMKGNLELLCLWEGSLSGTVSMSMYIYYTLVPELHSWECILGICASEYTEKMLVADFFSVKKSCNETMWD